jgi:preprotein translocase subunit SecB
MAPADPASPAPPTGNGAAGAPPPQLIVNAQYIKDLSFENPRAPQSLMQQKSPPEVGIEVDVKARNLAPEIYEVLLTISGNAKVEGEAVFIVQLTYAGMVTVRNAGNDILPALLLIETPRLLFPFARNVIANATREGGYPPLLINPIDFAELLRREQAKGQQPVETAE